MSRYASFIFTIIIFALPSSLARASSVAPFSHPRCSMTTPSTIARMLRETGDSNRVAADAIHLLPHLEIGMAPLGIRRPVEEKDAPFRLFRHGIVAFKPSVAMCVVEVHLTTEFLFGGDLEEGEDTTEHGPITEQVFGWRIGSEILLRPSRLFSEKVRSLDAVAVGFGATIGGLAYVPSIESGGRMDHEAVALEKIVEFGPRAVFDVNEWLGFTLGVNVHLRPIGLETGFTVMSGVQLSLPGHLLLLGAHE